MCKRNKNGMHVTHRRASLRPPTFTRSNDSLQACPFTGRIAMFILMRFSLFSPSQGCCMGFPGLIPWGCSGNSGFLLSSDGFSFGSDGSPICFFSDSRHSSPPGPPGGCRCGWSWVGVMGGLNGGHRDKQKHGDRESHSRHTTHRRRRQHTHSHTTNTTHAHAYTDGNANAHTLRCTLPLTSLHPQTPTPPHPHTHTPTHPHLVGSGGRSGASPTSKSGF